MKMLTLLCTLACLCGYAAAAERPADIYILSGQSNMQGTGLLAELPADDRTPSITPPPASLKWAATSLRRCFRCTRNLHDHQPALLK